MKHPDSASTTVSPDMLFRWLFIASNPKNLFGNPDWYIEWLGTVDCQSSAWYSDLRTPPALFCGNPPSCTWNKIGDEYRDGTLTVHCYKS
jgi:hypothetical protein